MLDGEIDICVVKDRIILHHDIAEEFTEKFVARTRELKVGNGFDDGVDVGPIISDRQRDRIVDLVHAFEADGAQILTGGSAVDGPGFFFEPTVIRMDGRDSELCTEELFAPLAALYTVSRWAPTTASTMSQGLSASDRVIVGHPANPPYLLPVVEVVPSPATRADIVERALATYAGADLFPIRLGAEVEGFVFNRLQGAVLREAYCLVRDGVASVRDIDAVMCLGLGRRWGVVGPFETVDLNTRGGIGVHAERMGPAYARMGAERGQDDPWTPDLVAEVVRQRREVMPLEHWDDRVRLRDERLMELTACAAGVRRPEDPRPLRAGLGAGTHPS